MKWFFPSILGNEGATADSYHWILIISLLSNCWLGICLFCIEKVPRIVVLQTSSDCSFRMFVWLEVQSSVKKLIVEPKFQLKVYVRMLLCLVSSQSASQSVDANGSKTDLYFLYYSHEILSSPPLAECRQIQNTARLLGYLSHFQFLMH